MYRIGIDIGGTNLAYGLVSEDGTLIKKVSYPVDSTMDDVSIAKCMAETAVNFIAECGISQEDVISIGLGVPGVCDDAKGVIVYTVNMPFRKTNICKIFKEYTSIPIHMANDAPAYIMLFLKVLFEVFPRIGVRLKQATANITAPAALGIRSKPSAFRVIRKTNPSKSMVSEKNRRFLLSSKLFSLLKLTYFSSSCVIYSLSALIPDRYALIFINQ